MIMEFNFDHGIIIEGMEFYFLFSVGNDSRCLKQSYVTVPAYIKCTIGHISWF